jgi:hypothetical protein
VTIAGGIARNTDLVLVSSTLNATGSGTADLERAMLDYLLRARSPQIGDMPIPVAITGPFSKPSYRVDTGRCFATLRRKRSTGRSRRDSDRCSRKNSRSDFCVRRVRINSTIRATHTRPT